MPTSYSLPSAAPLSSVDLGGWNTSTRLLASLLCDGLLSATPVPSPVKNASPSHFLLLHHKDPSPHSPAVWIGLSDAGQKRLGNGLGRDGNQLAVFPGDFSTPVAITTIQSQLEEYEVTYSPAALLTHLRAAIDNPTPIEDAKFNTICTELSSSAANGAHWIDWYRSQAPLGFKSSMLQWEQALYTGHPLHPMHRAFFASDPVPNIPPHKISTMMRHSISLISIPGSEVKVTGPVQQALKPLLSQFGLDHIQPGVVVLPCITMQIPVIQHYHPQAKVLIKEAIVADTQSSLRTITIPFSDYDFKFALDVTVGSALRTISSRTVTVVAELSSVLSEIIPENMWLLADIGGITGVSDDFDHSKHVSCVIRENLHRRAIENNETLVVTGALQEIPPHSNECNAALVFGLRGEEEKQAWFEGYCDGIIEAFLGPVADYGVAFEAHAQNVLIRMDRSTGSIKGWASRDLGSIKIHTPTLAKSGYHLTSMPAGSLIPTTSEEETWRIIQFCLFQNHLNVFIYRLGIDRIIAWKMIRSTLDAFFARRKEQENSLRLRSFLYAETIPQKAFMRMKFGGKAAVYEYSNVANVLLETQKEKVLLKEDGEETLSFKKEVLGNSDSGIHISNLVAVDA